MYNAKLTRNDYYPIGLDADGVRPPVPLDLLESLRRWTEFCTVERGYDWTKSNWKTEELERLLDRSVTEYCTSQCDLRAVHEAFVTYARAHREDYQVIESGESGFSVTPQWQPSSTEMREMVRLYGIELEAFSKQFAG